MEYKARHDHLILVGDLISKGPNSPAVVDQAISLGASCVRGNHEDRVLLAYRDLHSHGLTARRSSSKHAPPPPGPFDDGKPAPRESELDAERFAHGDAVDRKLARSLTQRQIDYLAACPVILKLGFVRGMGELQVVHAGLVPGLKLEKQDPVGVMNMRTVDLDNFVPSSSSHGMPWSKVCTFGLYLLGQGNGSSGIIVLTQILLVSRCGTNTKPISQKQNVRQSFTATTRNSVCS